MKTVRDITFTIGPPGPKEEQFKFEQFSKTSGKPPDEIWVEYVHEIFGNLSKLLPDQKMSAFDELLSRVLNTPVHIKDPFLNYTIQNGVRCPGVILYVEKIKSLNGMPLPVDWFDPKIRESIGAVFGHIFKAKWVRSYVA